VLSQEDDDSEDLDFLAESDDETASPTTATGSAPIPSQPPAHASAHKGLYQEMHTRVLQRLMGEEAAEDDADESALSSNDVTPLAGLVHSTDAFSFDAEEVLRNAQHEVRHCLSICIVPF